MNDFGQKLKAERERQSLLLQQVSGSIRVREDYLDAIERRDWDALPEPVFTRGYIQSYAQYLHLDVGLFLNAYARELRIARAAQHPTDQAAAAEDEAKALLARLARTQGLDTSPWWSSRWTALLVVGACAGAGVLWLFTRLPSARAEGRPPVEEAAAPSDGPSAAPSHEPSVAPSPEPSAASSPNPSVSPSPEPLVEPSVASSPAPSAIASVPASALAPPSTEPRQAPARSEPSASLPVTTAAPSIVASHDSHEGRLAIPEFGVGTGISGRQLVGRSDHFDEGTVVWFWTRVLEGRKGDTIRHVWLHEGRVMGVVKLTVGGDQWRTQSRWQLGGGSAGSWSVEARDADDRVLATMTFRCGSS